MGQLGGDLKVANLVVLVDDQQGTTQEMKVFEQEAMGLDRMVELITISIDTPFAQKRFAEEAKISNVTFLSISRLMT